MTTKIDYCELCGNREFVADYGFDFEYICVNCAVKDDDLRKHVMEEMIRKFGQAKVQRIMADATQKQN